MPTPPGSEDWIEAIEQGLTDIDNLVHALTMLRTGRGARQQLYRASAMEMLKPVVTRALTDQPQLIHALVKIVDLALPIYYAQGDAQTAKARAKFKRDAVKMIATLRALEWEPDDGLKEPARALCIRLEALQRDPMQWVDPYRVQPPKRGSGRPSFAFKTQARLILAEAGVPDPDAQLQLLRLLNIEPPSRGPTKKKPQP